MVDAHSRTVPSGGRPAANLRTLPARTTAIPLSLHVVGYLAHLDGREVRDARDPIVAGATLAGCGIAHSSIGCDITDSSGVRYDRICRLRQVDDQDAQISLRQG